MTRKARIDSATEAVRVMSAASQEIRPSSNVPLNVSDLPFFASVLAEFALSDWTAHQLELAALLARSMHDFEHEQTLMRQEGGVVFTESGGTRASAPAREGQLDRLRRETDAPTAHAYAASGGSEIMLSRRKMPSGRRDFCRLYRKGGRGFGREVEALPATSMWSHAENFFRCLILAVVYQGLMKGNQTR
jgi:hypothetical protein